MQVVMVQLTIYLKNKIQRMIKKRRAITHERMKRKKKCSYMIFTTKATMATGVTHTMVTQMHMVVAITVTKAAKVKAIAIVRTLILRLRVMLSMLRKMRKQLLTRRRLLKRRKKRRRKPRGLKRQKIKRRKNIKKRKKKMMKKPLRMLQKMMKKCSLRKRRKVVQRAKANS